MTENNRWHTGQQDGWEGHARSRRGVGFRFEYKSSLLVLELVLELYPYILYNKPGSPAFHM